MGLFDAFKKNNRDNNEQSAQKSAQKSIDTNAAADSIFGKQEIRKQKSDKDIVIDTLIGATAGGKRKDDSGEVDYPNEGFEITLLGTQCDKSGVNYIAQPFFFVALPNAESLIALKPIAIGQTKIQALQASTHFMADVINRCFDAIYERETDILENTFDGNVHKYRYPLNCVVSGVGRVDGVNPGNLFASIKKDIVHYIGAKKNYWVDLDITWDGNELDASVEINGNKCLALSEKLAEEKSRKFVGHPACYFRQIIMLVQEDSTYVKAKESYNESNNAMYKYVRMSLPIMGMADDDDSYESVYQKVRVALGDDDAAWEIMSFLPDIYIRSAISKNCGDTVVMYRNGQRLVLNELQISPISVMCAEVKNYLEQNQPDGRFLDNMMKLSKRFSDYAGKPTDNIIVIGEMECTAPDDYVIW